MRLRFLQKKIKMAIKRLMLEEYYQIVNKEIYVS